MGFIHLLHILIALSIVYIAFGFIVAVLAFGFIAFVFTKVIKAFKHGAVILAVLLAGMSVPRTVYAQAITDKQFAKEVEVIVRQDNIDIGEYAIKDHPEALPGAPSLYVETVKEDLALVVNKLHQFKHHHATRADVDQVLGQLLLDLERAPGTEDLKL